ncbi:hypothetical protein TNCV_1422241 [Trichonephila clavipes]|nr:hypothetical protein TNCV_1422241 [Trichonephila clavipes]
MDPIVSEGTPTCACGFLVSYEKMNRIRQLSHEIGNYLEGQRLILRGSRSVRNWISSHKKSLDSSIKFLPEMGNWVIDTNCKNPKSRVLL